MVCGSYGAQLLLSVWGLGIIPQRTRPLAVVCWAWMPLDVQEEPGYWLKMGEE